MPRVYTRGFLYTKEKTARALGALAAKGSITDPSVVERLLEHPDEGEREDGKEAESFELEHDEKTVRKDTNSRLKTQSRTLGHHLERCLECGNDRPNQLEKLIENATSPRVGERASELRRDSLRHLKVLVDRPDNHVRTVPPHHDERGEEERGPKGPRPEILHPLWHNSPLF